MAICPLGACCVLIKSFEKQRLKEFYMKQPMFLVAAHQFWVTQKVELDTSLTELSLLGKGSLFYKYIWFGVLLC